MGKQTKIQKGPEPAEEPISYGPAAILQQGGSLYEVLGVSEKVSGSELRKAYFSASMKYHPDRNRDGEAATRHFQAISQAYEILSDSEKRAYYDATGSVDVAGVMAEGASAGWTEYFRAMFQKVTLADVREFEKRYKHSPQERADVLEAFTRLDGDMDALIDHVLLASVDDEPRFRVWIDQALQDGTLAPARLYQSHHAMDAKAKLRYERAQAKKKRTSAREAEEASKAAVELGLTGDASLEALVRARSAERMNATIAALEAKYAPKSKRSKKDSKG